MTGRGPSAGCGCLDRRATRVEHGGVRRPSVPQRPSPRLRHGFERSCGGLEHTTRGRIAIHGDDGRRHGGRVLCAGGVTAGQPMGEGTWRHARQGPQHRCWTSGATAEGSGDGDGEDQRRAGGSSRRAGGGEARQRSSIIYGRWQQQFGCGGAVSNRAVARPQDARYCARPALAARPVTSAACSVQRATGKRSGIPPIARADLDAPGQRGPPSPLILLLAGDVQPRRARRMGAEAMPDDGATLTRLMIHRPER
jgi:hypothetical protein